MIYDVRSSLAQVPATGWVPVVVFVASVCWTIIRGAFTRREDWRNQVDEERDSTHDNFVILDQEFPHLNLDLRRPKR